MEEQNHIDKKEILRKKVIIPNIKNIKYNKGYSGIINFILFEIIFILLSKRISCEQHYVEIKVNKVGYNQILSDEYRGNLPKEIIVDGISSSMLDKKVNVNSKDNLIILKWKNPLSNFSYMFSNLGNIIYIHMNYMFGKDNIMSYMFFNCYNLEIFTYKIDYSISHTIIDMRNMFYNCLSLKSFQFKDLYMDYSIYYETTSYDKDKSQDVTSTHIEYNEISMSYMFYNCQSLKSIYFDSNIRKYITNMTKMFYNCFSLISLNLTKITTKSNIDASYMFYNCS